MSVFRGQETLSFVEYVGKELWSSCKQTIEAWHLVLKAELALCVVQVYVDCIHVHMFMIHLRKSLYWQQMITSSPHDLKNSMEALESLENL